MPHKIKPGRKEKIEREMEKNGGDEGGREFRQDLEERK